jgi:Uma2 family endonuclease
MATVLFQEEVEVPLSVDSLADFRAWASSDSFPHKGRIDFIAGRIEVDMAAEEIFMHGSVKSEIARVLLHRVKGQRLGHLWIADTRISCPEADLSAEPDIVFVSHNTLQSGRARPVPKAGQKRNRYVEVEGAPDLIVEVVSDSSVAKDKERLPPAYYQAGVPEFWLVDARGEQPSFIIHHRGAKGYLPVNRDARGFQRSTVFGCRFRLDCGTDPYGDPDYDLLDDG